ncbi:MAG: GNAT family N-acetyltransferase [Chitinispirillales bacterium]|jgi:hypothetical protein|nr:GNAT family N-acetyltransferase [Chitinispirillales bacterium]
MTDISVQSIATATRDKWLSVATACGYATYFHTPYWYERIVPKQKHIALEVTFNDGASAVIPMAEVKRACGLLTDTFSSPGGTYGGWVSAQTLNEGHAGALFGILASKKNLTFRVNPFDNTASKLSMNGFKREFTYVLDLTLGEQELYDRSNRGHKEKIRKAVREGITVRASREWGEWEQYYGLYRQSIARWLSRGPELKPKAVYPPEFFRRIYDNKTGHEVLWLALKNNEVIAGMLCFYWNKHAVGWHASASSRYFSRGTNNLLYWEIMLDAAKRGFNVFDCNPSGGYSGVETFKEHLGAARIETPLLQTKTTLRRMIAGLRGK